MKIMFLYMFPWYGNGSATFMRNIISELLKKNHKIAAVLPDKRKLPKIKTYTVKPPQPGVFVSHPELPKAKKYSQMNGVELTTIYNSYLNASIKAVKDFNPEIIHCFHTCFLPSVARVIKVMYGVNYIVTTHGSDLYYFNEDRRLIGLVKDALDRCRCITSVSEFTKKHFLKIFGYHYYRKVKVIPGGVTIHSNEKTTSLIDRKYKLKNKKVILFTGRLTKHKGVEYLLKAAKYIKDPQAEVFIIGEGSEEEKLKKQAKELKLKNINFLPYMRGKKLKELRQFYKRADIFVAPSIWNEPFGLVILEAMAYGTPVIATKKGGITSIVKDGVNGLLVRARASRKLATAINTLLENDKLRKKLGQKAYQTIVDKFTWESATKRFLTQYRTHRIYSIDYLKKVKNK